MAGGFVKVQAGIIHSTIWRAKLPTRVLWITMLAMADRSGMVEASIPGLADAAVISLEECLEGLETLKAPDAYSRTKECEGRRIVEVDGGWAILNYLKYREMRSDEDQREKNRLRVQKFREKSASHGERVPVMPVMPVMPRNPIAEAEAEVEVPPTVVVPAASPTRKHDTTSLRDEIIAHWRAVAVPAGLPDVLKLSDKLRKAMDTRLKDSAWLALFREAVSYAAQSPDGAWMRGGGDRRWLVTLDWMLKPDKAEEIAAKARACPRRVSTLRPTSARAADAEAVAQAQQISVPKLARVGGS